MTLGEWLSLGALLMSFTGIVVIPSIGLMWRSELRAERETTRNEMMRHQLESAKEVGALTERISVLQTRMDVSEKEILGLRTRLHNLVQQVFPAHFQRFMEGEPVANPDKG